MTDLPAYLDLKLKTTVARVTEAAREKGLEAVLAYELFDLRQRVEEAVLRLDTDLAKEALTQEQCLLAHIGGLPGRPQVSLQRTGQSAASRGG